MKIQQYPMAEFNEFKQKAITLGLKCLVAIKGKTFHELYSIQPEL